MKLQQVMRNASECNYIEKHRLNPKMDTAFDFFFTHPTTLELLSAFPRVLGIECGRTWRTKMTQLNIYGITSTDIPFWVASAFLSSEHKRSWGWALSTLRGAMDDKGVAMPDVIILTETEEVALIKAIDDVFSPAKLLFSNISRFNYRVRDYSWSILPDIFQRRSFAREWDLLLESPTEAEYDEQLKRLHTEFSMYPQVLAYVTNTWLKPYKEKFVAAWTDHIMHFGSANIFWYSLITYFHLITSINFRKTKKLSKFINNCLLL